MAKKVFLTGATGFIGTAIVSELIHNGYQVLGLTRSDEGKQSLPAAGAAVFEGDLDDLDRLRKGAETADAVIHTAFNHDFTKFKQNCEADRKVVEALGSALAGSNRPFVVTSGTSVAKVGKDEVATEQSPALDSSVSPRAASEEAAAVVAKLGVSVWNRRHGGQRPELAVGRLIASVSKPLIPLPFTHHTEGLCRVIIHQNDARTGSTGGCISPSHIWESNEPCFTSSVLARWAPSTSSIQF